MDFTFEFAWVFVVALIYAAPLLAVLVALIMLLGRIIGIREGWSRSDSFYYAFITATTVGYGDFHPQKRFSKYLAITITFIGLLLTGIIVAIALHAASHAFKASPHYKELMEKVEQIDQGYRH